MQFNPVSHRKSVKEYLLEVSFDVFSYPQAALYILAYVVKASWRFFPSEQAHFELSELRQIACTFAQNGYNQQNLSHRNSFTPGRTGKPDISKDDTNIEGAETS